MRLPMLLIACLLMIWTKNLHAAIQCNDCHGTSIPVDNRPIDASSRNPSSGGFAGNHRTHLEASASPEACETCHTGSGTYTAHHRDGLIKISSRINNSPRTTPYNNTTSAFTQTAAPASGSCTNINCHFETTTPTWGSPAFNSVNQCSRCHEGIEPLSATHAAHKRYSTGLMGKFSTYAACSSCHVNYSTPPTFTHATSAGNHPINVSIGGYNSGSMTYLPSQSHGPFGTCTNLYCHSPGTKSTAPFAPPIEPATWGSTLRTDCSSCHKGSATSFRSMSSGSHNKHVYLINNINCVDCHAATVTSAMTINDLSKHVNGRTEIAFSSTTTAVNGKYNGSLAPVSKTPGSTYGSCDNVYCHSNGQNDGGYGITYKQPVWGTRSSGSCGKCHDVNASHNFEGVEISSGSHTKHLSYDSMTRSSAVKCTQCHNLNQATFEPTCTSLCHSATALKHANHQIDILIPSYFGATATYDGSPQPGSGYSTCSNVYCHSDGTSLATGTVPAATSPAWGSGVMPCTGCHAFPPAYVTGLPKANSHTAHTSAGYGCNACHAGTTADGTTITSTTLHVNQGYSLSPGTGVSFTYMFHSTGGTCSNISCHNNGTAAWGTILTCGDCHVVSPGGD